MPTRSAAGASMPNAVAERLRWRPDPFARKIAEELVDSFGDARSLVNHCRYEAELCRQRRRPRLRLVWSREDEGDNDNP